MRSYFFFNDIIENSLSESENINRSYKNVFLQFNIIDKKTKCVKKFPTHCKNCEDNKFWDFNTYLNSFSNLEDSPLKCPICNKEIKFDDIIIDIELDTVLKCSTLKPENKILYFNRITKQYFFI